MALPPLEQVLLRYQRDGTADESKTARKARKRLERKRVSGKRRKGLFRASVLAGAILFLNSMLSYYPPKYTNPPPVTQQYSDANIYKQSETRVQYGRNHSQLQERSSQSDTEPDDNYC